MNETRTRITRVGAVVLTMSDQERALEFYLGKLGFEKRRDMPFGPRARWIEVAPPRAETTIAVVPAGMPTGVRLVTKDVAADHAEPARQGRRHRSPDHVHGARAADVSFRDPDGNTLVIGESGA